jgi:hypothetical protein
MGSIFGRIIALFDRLRECSPREYVNGAQRRAYQSLNVSAKVRRGRWLIVNPDAVFLRATNQRPRVKLRRVIVRKGNPLFLTL